jgi:isoleucyl-tRNA synthetase
MRFFMSISDTKTPTDMDYKDTVFLPKTEFPMRGNLAQKEPELLTRWRLIDLYGLLRKRGAGKPKFTLHDGPPYANGNIHIGHALNKILKDIVNRAHWLLGYDVAYVPGWDCHGLPIEWKIEEQYRRAGKDKDQVPVLQFRDECRQSAKYWMKAQSEEFQRLGVIGDWTQPYATMAKPAEAQIVREIHKFLRNGLLYKGVKSVMWSTVEKTALAEAEIEYHDVKSSSIWVKFPVTQTSHSGLKDSAIVIWTTTPWTIPANRAIAYGDFDYSILEVTEVLPDSLLHKGEKLVVAAVLSEAFQKSAKIVARIVETISATALNGTKSAHPLAKHGYEFAVPLLAGDFVTTETGTGFVHIAPGHGEDDFNLIQNYNLGKELDNRIPIESAVDEAGLYTEHHQAFAGKIVYRPDGKAGDANGAVIKLLSEVGALVAKQTLTHSYPHSWRSKAPVIFRVTPQWFIAMDRPASGQDKTLRDTAMTAIAETQWIPPAGQNRISGMVSTRPDWCISRQRAWGVPIAIFVNKATGEPLKDQAVLDRIASLFAAEGSDAWYSRPPEDFLGPAYAAADYEQVFDIVDVWFESGATHSFVLEGEKWPELQAPASLYLEGSDQHRGWFQSSLLESCGTRGRAPYEAVLTHGFTLDEQGRKMSKSAGNVTAPQQITEQMGADILRLWVAMADYQQDQRIGPEILKQIGDYYRRFRNTLRYLLGGLDGMGAVERVPHTDMPELERWVLHRLHALDATLRAAVKAHHYHQAIAALHEFCAIDLSAFYFDVRKDSLYCDRVDEPRRQAVRTVLEKLYECLTIWLAPFLCFTAEEAWLARHTGELESVHLQSFPVIPEAWQDQALANKWAQIRELRRVVTGALERARAEKRIGSSLQAAAEVYVTSEQAALLQDCDFVGLCLASSLNLHIAAPPAGSLTLPDVTGVGVVIALATGQKCERCWQVLPEVGHHADHPLLCERCYDAVVMPDKKVA